MVYMAAAFPSELSLSYNPTTYSMNKDQNQFDEQADRLQKLQEFISRLEDERLKIDAFKRELPLCIQLLNNAVETYRRQLEAQRTSQKPRLVLEEFIPLKNAGFEEANLPSPSEKASWMVSAQLWSADAGEQQAPPPAALPPNEVSDNSFALNSQPRCGGAFHAFSKEKGKDFGANNEMEEKKSLEDENGERSEKMERCSKSEQQKSKGGGGESNVSDEGCRGTQRKARRCWSPDLHRRFVNALQILGGSQVATPKQIRELMKIDGLTNDEKYRLHTRRPMPAAAAVSPAAPQLLLLGGFWVPPEYAPPAAAAAGPTMYGSHALPVHYCPSPQVPQDYYQGPPPPVSLPPLRRRGDSNPYKRRQISPESDRGSGGESNEEQEGQEGKGRKDDEEEEEEEEVLVALGVAKPEDSDASLDF